MSKLAAICATTALVLCLASCSGGNSSANPSSGTSTGGGIVLAQTSYSSASVNGTYSVTWWSFYGGGVGSYYSAVGTLQFNGAGTISGGTITEYAPNAPNSCAYNVGGTYAIQSSALGTATLNLTSTANGCPPTDTWKVALAAADGGAVVQMARTDQIANGSAVKQ